MASRKSRSGRATRKAMEVVIETATLRGERVFEVTTFPSGPIDHDGWWLGTYDSYDDAYDEAHQEAKEVSLSRGVDVVLSDGDRGAIGWYREGRWHRGHPRYPRG